MKLHIRIQNIEYNNYNPKDNNPKTICIIRWKNPITGNIQRSVGISKCNPSDKFDIVKGQRIAESRAKINMWKTYNSNVSYIIGFSVGRNITFIAHEKQHLHNLINDIKTN